MPKILQDAVIATEDRTFWTNDGIDIHSVFRAAIANVSSGSDRAGRVDDHPAARQAADPDLRRDVNRKVKEIVLALRLNKEYSKKEILQQYLNTVYFGEGSYGVESAVERLFLTPAPAHDHRVLLPDPGCR